jgi:hypothetical protein
MGRHEYRTAKAVTVAGILSGAGFALLGLAHAGTLEPVSMVVSSGHSLL